MEGMTENGGNDGKMEEITEKERITGDGGNGGKWRE